ncbi:MAG: alpha-L-fucosidase [bacterium]
MKAMLVAAGIACWCAAIGARSGEIPERYQTAIDRQLRKIDEGVAKGPYKPDWEDLKGHEEAPDWFRDAKFGIYWHWGVYSVPAFGNEWYPRHMHMKKRREHKHHVETYGEPDQFGYHDFVPRFKAEHFDAHEWAELLQKAGARYAGPVCEHHDGFAMWDSEVTPWNAADKGPQRDIAGELAKAIRARGMRFVTTFHHGRTNEWYPRVEGWPTTTTDPVLRMLYANLSDQLYYKIFLAKLGEVVDNYQPDLIWFDGRIENIEEPYHRRFLAYYFNNAKQWGRDVVVTTKGHDYPPEIAVEDFEKGRMNRLTDFCWLTDDTISMGSWCYTRGLRIKTTTKVIHDFIDIVSKNGCLLLNISPKADGTIPDEQRKVLLGMGEWLKVSGEAIYNTRPWLAFGEGPTRLRKGGGFVGHVRYTARDIRYTRSKDGQAVYAIALGWPEGDVLTLTAVKVEGHQDAQVHLLGREEPLPHKLNDAGQLVIDVSSVKEDQRPCEHAYAFKLTGFQTSLHPEAAIAPAPRPESRRPKKPTLSKDLVLEAPEVGLSGPGIRLETKGGGKPNIGFWDDPKAKALWQVQIEKAGPYAVKAVIATTAPGRLALDAGDQTLTADVPDTGGWTEQRTIDMGTIRFGKTGEHQLVLRPAEPAEWKAVNVWKLVLAPAK